jgi:hypothetical protein
VAPAPALAEIGLAPRNEAAAPPLPPIDRSPDAQPTAGEPPPPLLPPQPGTPALAAHPIAASLPTAPTVASRAAREETTEVHVTIGRIEVTAVHEAPPPRREPARRGKPKSLDEYLAGRQGRRA